MAGISGHGEFKALRVSSKISNQCKTQQGVSAGILLLCLFCLSSESSCSIFNQVEMTEGALTDTWVLLTTPHHMIFKAL